MASTPPNDPVWHIFRWDLDKTYLKTEFDSIKDLIKTALQRPEEKQNVPGAVALLREIRRDRDDGHSVLTFISGSPTQMRSALEKKFELDGIHPDSFVLKPTLENILKGRFKAIRGQVGYKLEALLRIHVGSAKGPETLFGDDAEQDAFIYSIYADLLSGGLDVDVLRSILIEANVYASTMQRILDFALEIETEGFVDRIFINLDRRSPPGKFLTFGPRVVPIVNYFQAALVFYADGTFSAENVGRVASSMIQLDDYGLNEFANSFQDLLRRRVLTLDDVKRLEDEVALGVDAAAGLPPGFAQKLAARVKALAPRSSSVAREWVGPPDYLEILKADRALKAAITEPKSGFFS